MTYRNVIRLGWLCFAMMCAPLSAAYADIGGVGSPVVPSNVAGAKPLRNVLPEDNVPPPAAAPAVAASVAAPAERQALLVIRFNQSRVYYQHLLQQAISMSEKAHPGDSYDVVSIVPSASRKIDSDHVGAMADRNLQNVVRAMQDTGVSAAQIHTSSESSAAVATQEIKIFAQ